jgi:hypothetical protein
MVVDVGKDSATGKHTIKFHGKPDKGDATTLEVQFNIKED